MSKKDGKKGKKQKRKQRGKEKQGVTFPIAEGILQMPAAYKDFVPSLKTQITEQRTQTVIRVNTNMILLYWHIGKAISEKQKGEGWGTKVIDRLSYDLQQAFPDIRGFSPRNLRYMKKFAENWTDVSILQRSVAKLPWRSNLTLLSKLKDSKLRLWYAEKTVENSWSNNMLAFQIESQLHLRLGNSVNNFDQTLSAPYSDYGSQVFKDPYIFDFLGTDMLKRELDLENKLIAHIQKFLVELGQGFAFVGRQVHLELDNKDFYIDLLFYHLKLRCYIVVELKAGEFKPEFISKLNLYQNVVDDVLKHKDDALTIGLLLVKEKSRLLVEYSIANNLNPMGVANWQQAIQKNLPTNLKDALPTIEEIETELNQDFSE